MVRGSGQNKAVAFHGIPIGKNRPVKAAGWTSIEKEKREESLAYKETSARPEPGGLTVTAEHPEERKGLRERLWWPGYPPIAKRMR